MNNIVIIGLGYVGLPLAYEFAKKHRVLGFDINQSRVNEINEGIDKTLEIENKNLKSVLRQNSQNKKGLYCSTQIDAIIKSSSKFFIVTVPTPVDKNNTPDLIPLSNATKLVGSVIKKGSYVIFESTVFPGATEDICNPILEEVSQLKLNRDYFLGYSPERINPGDKEKTLTKILKITSGSNKDSAIRIDNLYKSIISAGTYMAPSIRVAESAKVIENSQRDINIAFVNELAKIFNLLDIDTHEVLKAARTKWNFLPFQPGLVGGHCIGVDPYYLGMIAQQNGYDPDIILSGRRMNDGMAKYVVEQFIKLLIKNDVKVKDCKVLVLGVTFKENCPDIRNSKVFDIIKELRSYGIIIEAHDPWASSTDVRDEYDQDLVEDCGTNYDGIMLCVGHYRFINYPFEEWKKGGSIIYDLKGIISSKIADLRL
jgi:UDP-N-acetyl-D-glucosamine/UDP-N-acetyl-D-galactosamine dehydrogenase